jgi:hypothetical protein
LRHSACLKATKALWIAANALDASPVVRADEVIE